uniref:Uncharacterized protein n=1 Tax=viral metagenome TaxID=1070528 RepID=A0A6M3LS54_9ZZZZ
MNQKQVKSLDQGLYRVFWKDGGSSLSAIGICLYKLDKVY